MISLDAIERVRAESQDANNPSAEVLSEVLLQSRKVAVVGMSRDPAKPARRVPSYLAARGYEIFPINPEAERLLGRPVSRSLAELPEAVDIVLIFRPSADAAVLIDEALSLPGQPAVWLQEGIRADSVAEAARARGAIVVQDLCIFHVHRALNPAAG